MTKVSFKFEPDEKVLTYASWVTDADSDPMFAVDGPESSREMTVGDYVLRAAFAGKAGATLKLTVAVDGQQPVTRTLKITENRTDARGSRPFSVKS